MAADDIKKHQFTSENQPKKRRSRKGIPNRSTVYKDLLNLLVDVPDPERKRASIKIPLYQAAALGQLRSAMHGNTRAWIEIQDSLFGKQHPSVNTNGLHDVTQLSDDELDAIIKKLNRGYVRAPVISIIEAKQPDES